MNYLQKLFMLTVLGLGVCVKEVLPKEETIKDKIHNVIVNKASGLKVNNSKDLEQLLSVIQAELKIILKSAPEGEYKELKNAVNNLNPKNLLAALTNINTILKNIAPETKAIILQNVPANLRTFVG